VAALAGRRPMGQIEHRRSLIRRPRAGDGWREACAVEEPLPPLPSCPSAMGGGGEVAEAEGGRADEGARGGRACGLSGRRTRWVRGSGVGRWSWRRLLVRQRLGFCVKKRSGARCTEPPVVLPAERRGQNHGVKRCPYAFFRVEMNNCG
jgi:hypothetical protein